MLCLKVFWWCIVVAVSVAVAVAVCFGIVACARTTDSQTLEQAANRTFFFSKRTILIVHTTRFRDQRADKPHTYGLKPAMNATMATETTTTTAKTASSSGASSKKSYRNIYTGKKIINLVCSLTRAPTTARWWCQACALGLLASTRKMRSDPQMHSLARCEYMQYGIASVDVCRVCVWNCWLHMLQPVEGNAINGIFGRHKPFESINILHFQMKTADNRPLIYLF